jgi:putative FmdB family regulatory protein
MPTYDYKCQSCGHDWELFQSMNDSPVKSCPKCKKRKAKRLLGMGAGIIFKGTGFYETDYKKKSPEKKEGSSDSPSEKSTKEKDSTGKESTPKTESKKDSSPKKEKPNSPTKAK